MDEPAARARRRIAALRRRRRARSPAPLQRRFGQRALEHAGYNFDTKDRPALRKSAAVLSVRARVSCRRAAARERDPCRVPRQSLCRLPIKRRTTRRPCCGDRGERLGAERKRVVRRQPQRRAVSLCGAEADRAAEPEPTIANSSCRRCRSTRARLQSAAAGWIAAHDACFQRGATCRAAEFAELDRRACRTARTQSVERRGRLRRPNNNFLVEVNNWSALDTRYNFAHTAAGDQTATRSRPTHLVLLHLLPDRPELRGADVAGKLLCRLLRSRSARHDGREDVVRQPGPHRGVARLGVR